MPHCERKNKESIFKNGNPPGSKMGSRANAPSSQMGSRSGYTNNKPVANNNMRPNMNTKYGKK